MSLNSPDDVLLIRQIAKGQTAAIDTLYDRYSRLVFSVVLAIIGDHGVAEEVTLDVFVHVWRGAGTYNPARAKVSTWIAAIARHHAIDILRWQSSRVDSKSLYLDDIILSNDPDVAAPEDLADLSLQRKRVQNALSQLPSDQRQALFLAFFRGHSHQQIAELLNEPLGTVKTRIRLGMQKLRQILVDEGQSQLVEKSEKSEIEKTAYSSNKEE